MTGRRRAAHVWHMTSSPPAPQAGPLRLLWVDLETTGLDLDRDRLLEVAAVGTDADLNVLCRLDTLVRPEPGTLDMIRANPVVAQMHGASGLLTDLQTDGPDAPTLRQVEDALVGMVATHACLPAHPVHIAGGGVAAFDQPYLQRHMPALHGMLHYRPVDVSGMSTAYTMATGGRGLFGPKDRKAHRAMADILQDLALARLWWAVFRATLDDTTGGTAPRLTGDQALLTARSLVGAFADSRAGATTALDGVRSVVASADTQDILAGATALCHRLAATIAGQAGVTVGQVLDAAVEDAAQPA